MKNVPFAIEGLEPDAVDADSYQAAWVALSPAVPVDWRIFASLLASLWRPSAPQFVGLGGGQGAGKSTVAGAIVAALAAIGRSAVAMSIDDFYLPKAGRERLADDVHPLLGTRGPPGTHDVDLLLTTLERLTRPGQVEVPVFDKGIDDRSAPRKVEGPFDVVLLEGWCVGARPQAATDLERPINALEREQDPHGYWRGFVNAALDGDYARLETLFDCLIFLAVPGLAAVRRWRLQQELARPPSQRMNEAQVARFVAHYERLTKTMLGELPDRADVVVELNEDHGVDRIRFRVPDPGSF